MNLKLGLLKQLHLSPKSIWGQNEIQDTHKIYLKKNLYMIIYDFNIVIICFLFKVIRKHKNNLEQFLRP